MDKRGGGSMEGLEWVSCGDAQEDLNEK